MLIILEGWDGAGKTTLAKLLHNVLDESEIIHCTSETPNDEEFFKKIISAAHQRHIIADRFCYGQYVYQEQDDRPLTFYRDKDGTLETWEGEYEGLHNLEAYMLNQHVPVKLIYVYSDPKTIVNRLRTRGEVSEEFNGWDAEDLARIGMESYEKLWKQTLIQPIYYKT